MCCGGEQEFSMGQIVATERPEAITNLCGKSSIGEAVDVMARVECVVTNDSGLMHVATAVGTPILEFTHRQVLKRILRYRILGRYAGETF